MGFGLSNAYEATKLTMFSLFSDWGVAWRCTVRGELVYVGDLINVVARDVVLSDLTRYISPQLCKIERSTSTSLNSSTDPRTTFLLVTYAGNFGLQCTFLFLLID